MYNLVKEGYVQSQYKYYAKGCFGYLNSHIRFNLGSLYVDIPLQNISLHILDVKVYTLLDSRTY